MIAVRARPPDRASAADMMQFRTGAGVGGHVGAVLVLDTGPGFDVAQARRLLGERIAAVPRLRQRLHRAPPGCGRPYWADDPAFDLRAHVRQVPCPPPGDERALLDVAADRLMQPLPTSRPLWRADFVTGLAGGATGLVIVMNHVLADGIAGLALLAALLDAKADSAAQPGRHDTPRFPLPRPGFRALAADAWADRADRLARPVSGMRRLRQGLGELGGARPRRPLPPSSLNQPTGQRRRLDLVTADLAAVRDLGHAHGGTVNDVLLAAVAGALRALMAGRGEELGEVTMSAVVSARQTAAGGQLGNEVGVMPVTVPAGGDLGARVTRIAPITRERKAQGRGASADLLVPAFLLLGRVGLLRLFVNKQRLVHTWVTNLRGPEELLSFAGAPVRAIIPVPSTMGNVTVAFAALSYAGTLVITILSDPSRVPDAPVLATALGGCLGATNRAQPGPWSMTNGPVRPYRARP